MVGLAQPIISNQTPMLAYFDSPIAFDFATCHVNRLPKQLSAFIF
jgi:hypothetical protein